MDTELARTFLEIVQSGSFVRAAARLHVTQTAVSARVRNLEAQLGRALFVRNKAGASLTPAGEQFLRYAPAMVQLWQRARYGVAVPAGHRAVLAVGAEPALWDPLLLRWLVWMRKFAPDIALRVFVTSEELTRRVAEGTIDVGITYAPQNLPGLEIERVFEDRLVMVATKRGRRAKDPGYVHVDWGPEFSTQFGRSFPGMTNHSVSVDLGPLGRSYILETGGSGYFRESAVRANLASGSLHLVPRAPSFAYPAYAVWSSDADGGVVEPALKGLRHIANKITPRS